MIKNHLYLAFLVFKIRVCRAGQRLDALLDRNLSLAEQIAAMNAGKREGWRWWVWAEESQTLLKYWILTDFMADDWRTA